MKDMLKMMKKIKKKIDVGDAPLDTMDLYILSIPFLKNRSKGWN